MKNQILLVRSLPEIIKFRANAMLVLVGEGPSKELIMEEARSLGVESHLVLTGPRMDVASLLSAFDVFAFPSVFEGLGMAAAEAHANRFDINKESLKLAEYFKGSKPGFGD